MGVTNTISVIIQGVDAASDVFDVVSAAATNAGRSITNFGIGLTAATAPLALFGATGIKAAASFEDVFTEISARTGVVGADLDALKERALKWGADTVFSSQQVGEAFLQMLTAGLDVTTAVKMMDPVLAAAAASGEDLGSSTERVLAVMQSFRLPVEEAANVVELLNQAAGASPATMAEMADAMKDVGGIASTLNIDAGDISATLAIFAKNGIKGAEAGTQLRSMLTHMTSPVKSVKDAWAQLGVSMFNADGSARNFADVMKEVDASLSTRSAKEQNEIIHALAGSFGQVGFNALMGSEGIAAMREEMGLQTSASDVAAARMNTFNQKVASLQGSFEALQTKALTPFMDEILKPLIDRMILAVNAVADWTSKHPGLTKAIVAFGAALVTAGPLLVGLGLAISAISLAFSPLTLIIGGVVVGLSALFAAFASNFGGIRDLVQPVLDQVGSGIQTLIGVLGNLQNTFKKGGITEVIASIINAFMQMAGLVGNDQMAEGAETMAARIVSAFQSFVDYINNDVIPVLQRIWDAVRPAAEAILNFVGSLIESGVAQNILDIGLALMSWLNPLGIVNHVLQLFGTDLLTLFEDIMGGVTRFFNTLAEGGTVFDGLRAAIPGLSELITRVEQGFNGIVGIINTLVIPALQDVYNWFVTEAAPAIVNFVQTQVIPAVQGLFNFISGVWELIRPALESVFNWFVNEGLPAISSFVTDIVLPAVQEFFNFIQAAWDLISPALQSIFEWFTQTALPEISNFITGTVQPVVEGFFNFIKSVWDLVSAALGQLFKWFVENGLPVIQGVIEKVNGVINTFIDVLVKIWETVRPGVEALANGIKTLLQPILDLINKILGAISDIGNRAQALGGAGQAATAIAGKVSSGEASIGDVIGGFARSFISEISGGRVKAYASGTDYVPRTGVAMLHQGEAVIPATMNSLMGRGLGANTPRDISSGGAGNVREGDNYNITVMVPDTVAASPNGNLVKQNADVYADTLKQKLQGSGSWQ